MKKWAHFPVMIQDYEEWKEPTVIEAHYKSDDVTPWLKALLDFTLITVAHEP